MQPRFFLACLIVLISCSSCNQKEAAFRELVAISDLNSSLKVQFLNLPQLSNTSKINDPIHIEIINQSQDTIRFDYNEDIHIYWYVDGEWIAQSNQLTQLPGEEYLEPGDAIYETVHPYFSVLGVNEDSITLMVFIEGQIVKENVASKDKVGTYLEAVLYP